MKVINEWDGEPARTPTQIIQDWFNRHHRDIESYGIAGPPVDALMTALAPLFAAGPWRTDVENAEFVDGDEYLIEYTHAWFPDNNAANVKGTLYYEAERDRFAHSCHGIITRDRLRAFATINQPEIHNA